MKWFIRWLRGPWAGPPEPGPEKDPRWMEDLRDAAGDVWHDRSAPEIYFREVRKQVKRWWSDL